MKKNTIVAGSLYVLFAAVSLAFMSLLTKFAKGISVETLVWGRSMICLLVLLPFIFFPQPKSLRTTLFADHFVRALFGLGTMYTFFYSIKYIILTDAVLLNNTMPLFIPIILWIWNKEKIPPRIIPGLIAGFIGVVLILKPGADIFHIASLLALASGLFMSLSMARVRELAKIEPPYRILFYYFFIATVIATIPLLWTWKPLSLHAWWFVVGIGVSAALYQYGLTKGYQLASPSLVSPLIYFAVILSGLFDWLFWGVVPTLFTYIGTILVISGAIYCLTHKEKLH